MENKETAQTETHQPEENTMASNATRHLEISTRLAAELAASEDALTMTQILDIAENFHAASRRDGLLKMTRMNGGAAFVESSLVPTIEIIDTYRLALMLPAEPRSLADGEEALLEALSEIRDDLYYAAEGGSAAPKS